MNFKIITVNGNDLSGASHEEASRAFENAPEPITVVLRRGNSTTPEAQRSTLGKSGAKPKTVNKECFCHYLMENCTDSANPLSSLIMREYLRFQNNQNSSCVESNDVDSYNDEDFSCENEFYELEFEEVTLRRTAEQGKLGITLFDDADSYNKQTKVIVTHVAPNTVAAQSQKIFEGDQILKIDGNPVYCTVDACRMLKSGASEVTFLIGRPRFSTDGYSQEYEDAGQFAFRNDDVLRDVTNYPHDIKETFVTSQRGASLLNEMRPEITDTDYPEIASEQISCNSSLTAESNLSKRTSSGSQSAKDSGIGHTLESSIQDTLEKETRSSIGVRTSNQVYTSLGQGSHTLAEEFTCVQPQVYNFKKQESLSKPSPANHNLHGSVKAAAEPFFGESNNLRALADAIENFSLTNDRDDKKEMFRTRLSSIDEMEDNLSDITSPWVHIAHQEYLEKMRQLQLPTDARSIHPALMPISPAKLGLSTSILEDATDNTSSAYNTGESSRSSTSEDSRLNAKLNDANSSNLNAKNEYVTRQCHVTMTYSSDANSDGDGPACYLTHNEASDSEGFEDARVEFRSVFTPKLPSPHPVPLPRILHPPHEATSFMAHSLTASTKNLWKATAAAARNRRQHNSKSDKNNGNPCVKKRIKWKLNDETNDNLARENTAAEANNPIPSLSNKSCLSNGQSDSFDKGPNDANFSVPKTRTFSEHIRPSQAQPNVQRSASCSDAQNSSPTENEVQMEWKVRVSRDGTRYITKRPVRERLLRQREKRLLAERNGLTTDDDFTEMKLGRHWSRDERKRHLRVAREKKRRRELMQQCRMEALNENNSADGEIVELSQKKQSKQKHKRMLMDNFVTVQEILAHGNRSNEIAKANPLLSVTYI